MAKVLDPTDLGHVARAVASDTREISPEAAEQLLDDRAARGLALAYRIRSWLWLVLGLALGAGFLLTWAGPWSAAWAVVCLLICGQEWWHHLDSARAIEGELDTPP